jgi:DNA-binding transcriptional ArsR family regulator
VYCFTSWLINRLGNYTVDSEQLDRIFAALADPTRRAILLRLAMGEATVNELAEPFAISLPAISKHLKVLERAGLITRGKEAQYRPCRLETDQLKFAFDWLERYRQHWEESFDRLDDFLQEVQSGQLPTPIPKAAAPISQDINDHLPEPQPKAPFGQ